MNLPLKTGAIRANEKTDFRLMIARLEKRILDGTDEEKTRSILMNEEAWKRLEPDLMLHWASLCQMAGCLDTADKVYNEIHRVNPTHDTAWERHMEMVDLLGKTPELVKLLETARRGLSPSVHGALAKRFSPRSAPQVDRAMDRAAKPFEQLRTHQSLADHFLRLFAGRPDCFARQWADKTSGKSGYVPVRQPLRHQDLEAHFKGYETCGIYLIHHDDTVRVAVIDADLSKKIREGETLKKSMPAIRKESQWMTSRILDISREAGMKPWVEISGGKGFHYWYFFGDNVPAGSAKATLLNITSRLASDLEYFNLEVFPKQDHLSGQGFGNLVKLPLGVHRKTGKRSWFAECPDRDVEAQLLWFSTVKPGSLGLIGGTGLQGKNVVTLHPRFTALSEKWPDLAALSSACPPLGRLITACFSGSALSTSEQQVLYQTLGFLPQATRNLHAVFGAVPDYNPHLVDLKISRLRGTALGCRRIHSILGYTGDMCPFPSRNGYPTPLLHLGIDMKQAGNRSEKIESLKAALDHLREAMEQVERFIP